MPHIDAPSLFGDEIVSVSLLSPCTMTFYKEEEQCHYLLS